MRRKTSETDIQIQLKIKGSGKSKVDTGINFLDHMLTLFAKHGAFDVSIKAKGDLHIDQHHLVEDLGIALAQAFDEKLKDRKGINRAGFFAMPMDEALAIFAIDLGGRPYLSFKSKFKKDKVGDLDSDLIQEFFQGFANNLKCNVHIRSFDANTDHHSVEAIFKAFARALRMAASKDKQLKDQIPSTKGLL